MLRPEPDASAAAPPHYGVAGSVTARAALNAKAARMAAARRVSTGFPYFKYREVRTLPR
jgi:hypothetical protein